MSDRAQLFVDAFAEAGGDEQIGSTRLSHLSKNLGAALSVDLEFLDAATANDIDELAWAFDSLAISAFRAGASEGRVASLAERAFHLRASLWSSDEEISIYHLWMLVVSGTLAQKQPELRLLLSRYEWPSFELNRGSSSSWPDEVWKSSAVSLGMLARKSRSWADIDEGIEALRHLAGLQRERETELFAQDESGDWHKDKNKCKLLGLYHVAEALILLGTYLRTGEPENIRAALQRHSENARLLLAASGDYDLERIGDSLEPLTSAMARASIWFNTSRLSQAARFFAQQLVGSNRESPVSELWWSQREALGQSLLDPYKIAISVQMPTSAGKTLIAEFSIVQTMALNPDSTVAYLVPTRALVNQMTRRLREDLAGARSNNTPVTVEAAVPVFELDPTENTLLSERPDVLVTTPEKLDLLVRSDHPSVADLSLVVVDEAHHIADAQRGPRLELLLATLKRERGISCRFLLLTPFLPNADDLSRWLGEGDGVAIELNWKPSEQIRALGHWTRKAKKFRDSLQLVPSATQPENWSSAVLDLGEASLQPNNRQRTGISTSLAISLSERLHGGALILTGGPGKAEERALQVMEALPESVRLETSGNDLLAATIDYVVKEMGSSYPLARTLPYGVAFHHAGLPPEIRALIEVLLAKGTVRIVSGTSTLAQGVDFPLSSVIVETLTLPQGRGKKNRPLRYSEFWNIAGRAGRALKDSVGVVVYPCAESKHDAEFIRFLEGEASKVVSALLGTIDTLHALRPDYNLALVRGQPALSHFFQYLTHALKVAGYDTASAEIEEILRSSLAFHTLHNNDRDVAERLVSWARGFLAQVRSEPLLAIADVTGLSLPSVGRMSAMSPRAFSDPTFWHPENLFGRDLTPLAQVVEVIADIPEMSLGFSDEPGGLNARRVAGVLRDWVHGKSLPEIADAWFPESGDGLSNAGRYLFRELSGQLPWGLGALQMIKLSGRDDPDTTAARHVPAMSFYGVDTIEALPMRMIGIPRAAANEFGSTAPPFGSFQEARRWISGQPQSRWADIARDKGFAESTLKAVWDAVGGATT